MPGKRVQFDEETWRQLDLLGRDQMKDFQELADEAFRDLLTKARPPGRPERGAAAQRRRIRVDSSVEFKQRQEAAAQALSRVIQAEVVAAPQRTPSPRWGEGWGEGDQDSR